MYQILQFEPGGEEFELGKAAELSEARKIVKKALGVRRLHPRRDWHNPPADWIEGYITDLDKEYSGGVYIIEY